MDLASAYPSSDISATTMTVIALVMVGSLVIWLVLVYRAAIERPGKRPSAALASGKTAGHDENSADSGYHPRGAAA